MSLSDGPGEGTWSVFAQKVVEERDEAREQLADVRKQLEATKLALRKARAALLELHDLMPMNGPEERWAIQNAHRLANPLVKRALKETEL